MAASAGALRRAAQRILSGGAAARAAVAGQPTPLTHPELLRPGELLPGISAAEFTARRDQLAGMLPPGGIAVLPASPLVFMAGGCYMSCFLPAQALPRRLWGCLQQAEVHICIDWSCVGSACLVKHGRASNCPGGRQSPAAAAARLATTCPAVLLQSEGPA
jgi:hypothetical protein